jgi:hypothetical protein
MKKVFPFLIVVLLAFVGCHRDPVMYEKAGNPRQLVEHVEKFVNQTEKYSRHYSGEDWQVAVEQFVVMSKDYVDNRYVLTEEEQMRFDNARLKFMEAIDAHGSDEITKQVKEAYNQVLGQK